MGVLRVFALLFVALALVLRFIFSRGKSRRSRTDTTGEAREPSSHRADALQKDPYCGTYVAPPLAVTLSRGGQQLYFCSDTCRKAFLQKEQS